MDVLGEIQKLNFHSGNQLAGLEQIAAGHENGSIKQFAAVTTRLMTPLYGDADIANMVLAAHKIDPANTRGGTEGPFGPDGALIRLLAVKYGAIAGTVFGIYQVAEQLGIFK